MSDVSQTIMNFIQLAVCATLAGQTFIRMHKMNSYTWAIIRHSFVWLFGISVATGFSPWVWKIDATWLSIMTMIAILIVQTCTSHYWQRGVPRSFDSRPVPLEDVDVARN